MSKATWKYIYGRWRATTKYSGMERLVLQASRGVTANQKTYAALIYALRHK